MNTVHNQQPLYIGGANSSPPCGIEPTRTPHQDTTKSLHLTPQATEPRYTWAQYTYGTAYIGTVYMKDKYKLGIN